MHDTGDVMDSVDKSVLRVVVEPPDVQGEQVTFRWRQSAPNAFQRQDSFYLRYDGVDLSAFTSTLLFEVFLGLQLKVFAAYGTPVEVIFPEPLPDTMVAFWRAFYDAEQVTVGPVSGATTYSPWASARPKLLERKENVVFFGGGKDSMLTTSLLSELYGSDRVLIVQFVAPTASVAGLMERRARRQESLMLRPARERIGVATQRVWTDYQANFRDGADRARPHVELFNVGALPLLLARGANLATFSYAWQEYPIRTGDDGSRHFRYPRSRPEVLNAQSLHYRRTFGAEGLTLSNLALLFSSVSTLIMLTERYPERISHLCSCTSGDVDQRWCYNCKKCGLHVWFTLGRGWVDEEFDYERMLTTSRYVAKLVAYAQTGVDRSYYGNAPINLSISAPIGYQTTCHAIAGIRLEAMEDRLSPEAFTNLAIVQALWGNSRFPCLERIPNHAVTLLDNSAARGIVQIAAEHLGTADVLPRPHLMGSEEVTYDFSIEMPTRLTKLPHLN
jgi:hypothetical protein